MNTFPSAGLLQLSPWQSDGNGRLSFLQARSENPVVCGAATNP